MCVIKGYFKKNTNLGEKISNVFDFTISVAVTDIIMVGRITDFPGGASGKESPFNTGDLGSVPGSGRPPGEGNGNPCQYSCQENPLERGA